MAKPHKPWASYCDQKGQHIDKEFNTYAELRKSIPMLLTESINGEVCVTRTRRGTWGQWFEVWEWRGKPTITKETWL